MTTTLKTGDVIGIIPGTKQRLVLKTDVVRVINTPVVKTREMNSGIMNPWFYKQFVRERITKPYQKMLDEMLQDEDEDYIEYYVVGIPCKFAPIHYSELFMIDVNLPNGEYLPVVFDGMHGSSAYAMTRSGMDRDDDEDDTPLVSDEHILEMIPSSTRSQVSKYL